MPGLVAALRAFACALTWRLGFLALADQGEEAAEPLVLQHRRLGDAQQLVEGPVGHAPALVTDLQAPIGEVHDLGKVISDGAHWHYYLKPNGAIDGEEINRRRKGHWRLDGNRLCIVIVNGAQPDECWDVTEKDGKLMFGTYGEVTYWVKVKPPPL